MIRFFLPVSVLILVSFALINLVKSDNVTFRPFTTFAKDQKGVGIGRSETAEPAVDPTPTPLQTPYHVNAPAVRFQSQPDRERDERARIEASGRTSASQGSPPPQKGRSDQSRINRVIGQAQRSIETPEIKKPSAEDRVKGTVKIEVNAPEAFSVELSIQTSAGPAKAFFIGVSSSDSGRFSYDWDTTNTPNWTYSLIAKANYNFAQSLFAQNINIIVDNRVPETQARMDQINRALDNLGLPPAGSNPTPALLPQPEPKKKFNIPGKCDSEDSCRNFCERGDNKAECVNKALEHCGKPENKEECRSYLDNLIKISSETNAAPTPIPAAAASSAPAQTPASQPTPTPSLLAPTPTPTPPSVGGPKTPSSTTPQTATSAAKSASPSAAVSTPSLSSTPPSPTPSSISPPGTTAPETVALPSVPDVEVVANPSSQLGFSPASVSVSPEVAVEKIENTTKDNKTALTVRGKAPPFSIVTLYILSDPIVVTVKADANGNWSYTLDKPLVAGDHEVFVTVAKSDGSLVRSDVSTFAVAKAAGTNREEGLVLVADSGNKFQVFITYTAGLIVLAVVVLLMIFFFRKPTVVEDVVD